MIEKYTLKFIKTIKMIVAICIGISVLAIFGCIGGYDTNTMTTIEFGQNIVCITLVCILISITYAFLEKIENHLEITIITRRRAERNRKMRKQMLEKTSKYLDLSRQM